MSFLIKMPLNFLPSNAPNKIKKQYPDVKNWYIGGHSHAGLLASTKVSKQSNDYKGLILLASYSVFKNLSKTNIKALSIIGSEDGIVTSDTYNKYKKNLSKNFN